jgi:hypothetical protein
MSDRASNIVKQHSAYETRSRLGLHAQRDTSQAGASGDEREETFGNKSARITASSQKSPTAGRSSIVPVFDHHNSGTGSGGIYQNLWSDIATLTKLMCSQRLHVSQPVLKEPRSPNAPRHWIANCPRSLLLSDSGPGSSMSDCSTPVSCSKMNATWTTSRGLSIGALW